jgi:hypothetical protein
MPFCPETVELRPSVYIFVSQEVHKYYKMKFLRKNIIKLEHTIITSSQKIHRSAAPRANSSAYAAMCACAVHVGPFGCCSVWVWVWARSGDNSTTPPVTRLLSGSSRPRSRGSRALRHGPQWQRAGIRARGQPSRLSGEGMASSATVVRRVVTWTARTGSSIEQRGRPDLRRNDAGQGQCRGCGRRFTVSQVRALLFSASSVDLVVRRCTLVPVPIALGEDCSLDSKIPQICALPCLRACSASVASPVLFQQRRLAALLSFAIAPMTLLSTTYMESLHRCLPLSLSLVPGGSAFLLLDSVVVVRSFLRIMISLASVLGRLFIASMCVGS